MTAAARRRRGAIAVALHDIEPATFESCALIRDWLYDHGIDRVTLLVIPARDLHPLDRRSPEMVAWLEERRRAGDAIAQHGFQHRRLGPAPWPRRALAPVRGGHSAEFLGLDRDETRRAVDAGWRVLKLAGIEPGGFVAPAYAYTPALRDAIEGRFRWWAGLLRFHAASTAYAAAPRSLPAPAGIGPMSGPPQPLLPSLVATHSAARARLAPAIGLATAGPLRRALSPTLLRSGALLSGELLRLDLHPADLRYPRHMLAFEWVLKRSAARRTAVTYDELAS